ncbi:MAG: hypothetical protein A2Z70_01650 [Chloroflexi bacterium RBG_13_48_17]|nr:MAG: hypothetical protein A2Z70_01650 [Chloroflexi bacterium RBG_13_48_17]
MGLSRQWKMARKDATKDKKRGFYSQALDEAERLELEEARGIDGVDEEIAMLRVKLRELIVAEPERFDLLLKLVSTIARLVTTRYNVTKEQKKSLKEAVTRVLTEIAVPLGIKAIIK